MERLTIRHSGVAVIKDKSKIKAAMERLAQYEEMGLTLAEERAKHAWIPADNPPKDDHYILLSFENLPNPWIGRYKENEDGGAYLYGETEYAAIQGGLIVNAWQPLPVPYVEESL